MNDMKKDYIKPSVEVIQADECQLLAGSIPEYEGPFNSRTIDFMGIDDVEQLQLEL